MTHQSERGPEDYEVSQDEIRKLLRGVGHLLSKPQAVYYNESGDSGERKILTWILGVLSTLTASAVIGAIVMYGKLAAIETGVIGHEQRIDRLERINEGRYRGPVSP